jgi:hypothetical protein
MTKKEKTIAFRWLLNPATESTVENYNDGSSLTLLSIHSTMTIASHGDAAKRGTPIFPLSLDCPAKNKRTGKTCIKSADGPTLRAHVQPE